MGSAWGMVCVSGPLVAVTIAYVRSAANSGNGRKTASVDFICFRRSRQGQFLQTPLDDNFQSCPRLQRTARADANCSIVVPCFSLASAAHFQEMDSPPSRVSSRILGRVRSKITGFSAPANGFDKTSWGSSSSGFLGPPPARTASRTRA
jgi:hypothetical protein